MNVSCLTDGRSLHFPTAGVQVSPAGSHMMSSSGVEVSVVIPVLNEAPNIGRLCSVLRHVLDGECRSFELVFVAGGSTDGTEEAVLEERERDPRVKLLWLSRNFGHQEAVSAGLDYSCGRAVITMDGDFQHPPELLPLLLRKWREGFEVVTTARVSTADAGFLKRVTSRWFYAILNRLSSLELREGSADFRLLDRAAVDALCSLPERSRFLRGMVQWIGFRQTSVAYRANARREGASKYSVRRLVRLALRATVAFSASPLYFVAIVGFLLAGLSFAYGLYAILAKLLADVPIVGWVSVLTVATFLGGVQLISLGVVGAYVAQIYEETKGRPVYLVRKADGFSEHERAFLGTFEDAATGVQSIDGR